MINGTPNPSIQTTKVPPQPVATSAQTKPTTTTSEVTNDGMNLSSDAKLAIWSEFVPYKSVMEKLPILKAKGLAVCVSITPKSMKNPDLVDLIKKAQEMGVEVRPWLELGGEDDVWANKWNVDKMTSFAKDVTSYLSNLGVKPSEISIDMEPPKTLTDKVGAQLQKKDIKGARNTLIASSNNGSLAEAQQKYKALVDDLHQQGIKVHVVTTPMVLDDLKVGGARLQSALGVPIEGINWDEVSFMTYRPEFENMAGAMGSDIIYSYGKDAVKYFGDKAGLDLGEVGSDGYNFTDPKQLQDDLKAAEKAGIKQAQVFSLDALQGDGQLEKWFTPTATDDVSFEPKALATRLITQAVARSLPEADTQPKSKSWLDKAKGVAQGLLDKIKNFHF